MADPEAPVENVGDNEDNAAEEADVGPNDALGSGDGSDGGDSGSGNDDANEEGGSAEGDAGDDGGDDGDDDEVADTFERDLKWCIGQLELGLLRSDADDDQRAEVMPVLKLLRSTKTSKARKRAKMALTFGDYRGYMSRNTEEELEKIYAAAESKKGSRAYQRKLKGKGKKKGKKRSKENTRAAAIRAMKAKAAAEKK